MQKIITITKDNSHTFYVPEINEHYHSINGAITESNCVFIQNGLYQFIRKQNIICILEVGFGTGLNALLTAIEAEMHQSIIFYTAIEPYPINLLEIEQLNYPNLLENLKNKSLFNILHKHNLTSYIKINEYLYFRKFQTKIQDFRITNNEYFNIIYYDAFSPMVQPEMWTDTIFFKLFNYLKNKGILVTYCSKGSFRRTLTNIGFKVEKLPGPPGKREVIRAVKIL